MKKSIGSVFLALVFLTIVLNGCAPASTPVPPAPPTNTPVLTSTPTKLPTVTPTPTEKPFVFQSEVEVVTDRAVIGGGGNNWGGHQTRIVHTQDGVFTAYTVDGGGQFTRNWKLAQRQIDGTWVVVAEGEAGQQPVNLLASPDGTLHVIGWPSGVATMWSGKPNNGTLTMITERIPNVVYGNYPYSSAGTDASGDLCILSSVGGNAPIGWFKWACYIPAKSQWITQTNKLDYRFAYTYVFPQPDGQLSLVSTRDVVWGALGYKQPVNTFDWVFNAFGYWRTNDIASAPIQLLSFAEEVPTEQYPYVFLNAQLDAYLDTKDRMHILYTLVGSDTGGNRAVRHRIVSPSGTTLFDGEIPEEAGGLVRIFQDKNERFFLLCESGLLYPMDGEGIKLEHPIKLDFGRYQVEYSGFGLSVPRTGTPLSNVIDVVFPSSKGVAWIYFQLDFSSVTTNSDMPATQSPVLENATPTVSSFQNMLDNARVLFTTNLSDPTMPGWDWWDDTHSANTTESGTIIFNKDQKGGTQIGSQYGLKENEGCLALFRSNDNSGFTFDGVSGDWQDSTWRAWGIGNSGTQTFYQLGYQNGSYESLGFSMLPGHWYYNLLWVKDQTTFVIRVWEKSHPEVYAEKKYIMSDTFRWAKRAWNCHLSVESGTLEMGSYQELRFNQMP